MLRQRLSGVVLALTVNCTDAAAPPLELVQTPLLDATPWRAYAASEDPLTDHQPARVECHAAGFRLEGDQLEIDTNYCNYLLAEHPTRISISRGTEVSIELSHYDLTSADPAKAHAALLFGDTLVWETFIDIPSAADVVQATFRTPRALAAGEVVRVHLHNHGQNNYALAPIRVLVPETDH